MAEDVEKKLDISNYELNWPLPKGKNKKAVGLMKDELRGKIMKNDCSIMSKNIYLLNKWQ